MALLHCEGFDGQTAELPGTYWGGEPITKGSFSTGRFGTGSAYVGTPTLNDANEFRITFPEAKSVIYTGVAIKNGTGYSASTIGCLFSFVSAGVVVLTYRINYSNVVTPGQSRMVRGTGNTTGTTIATGSVDLPGTVWNFLEMKVVCGTGTSGSIIVRQNGVETINVTGVDTGSASLTGLGLSQRGSGTSYYGDGWAVSLDDWWVCDDTGPINNNFLGDCRVLTAVPIGPGSSTQLVPSAGANWQCQDEIPPTTTDYVSSATPGYKDLYDFTALGASYTDIKGARLVSYALASDAGTIKGRAICKSGVTTGTGSDNTMLATAQAFSFMFETDPNTGAPWSNANINAAEFGWEVRS
jgi:hypothetical protein